MGAEIKGIPAIQEVCTVGNTITTTTNGTSALIIKNAAATMIVDFSSGATGTGQIYVKNNGGGTFCVLSGLNGIVVGSNTIDASSILVVNSTTKGFLLPRMTTAQKNAIGTPTEGLIVYDTDLHKACVRVAAAWETISSA